MDIQSWWCVCGKEQGSARGAELLKTLGAFLRSCLSTHSVVARWQAPSGMDLRPGIERALDKFAVIISEES